MPHQPTIMVWKSESAPKLHAGGPSEIHHFNLDVERLEIFGMHPEQQADYHVSGKVTFKGKAPAEFGRKDLVAVCVLDTAHLLSEKTKDELIAELHKMIKKVKEIPIDPSTILPPH